MKIAVYLLACKDKLKSIGGDFLVYKFLQANSAEHNDDFKEEIIRQFYKLTHDYSDFKLPPAYEFSKLREALGIFRIVIKLLNSWLRLMAFNIVRPLIHVSALVGGGVVVRVI